MELEAWIRSFEARHWESLSSIFGDLPSGMQESLRCCVNGTSLPLSLVLQQVASCNNPPKATEIEVTMPPPINPGASSTAGAEAEESRWARPTRRVTFSETDHQTERSRSPRTARSRSPLARPRNGRECPICHATPQHMRSHVEQDHLLPGFIRRCHAWFAGRHSPPCKSDASMAVTGATPGLSKPRMGKTSSDGPDLFNNC